MHGYTSRRRRRRDRGAHRYVRHLPKLPSSVALGAAFLFALHVVAITAHPSASASVSDAAQAGNVTTTAVTSDAPTTDAYSSKASAPAATGDPVHVVGLGDSVATSTACACEPYLQGVAKAVADVTHRPVGSVANWGSDGIGVEGVAEQLTRPDVRSSLSRATVVTLAIGANDMPPSAPTDDDCLSESFCFRGAVAAERAPLTRVVSQLRALAPHAAVVVLGYWNVYLDGAVGAAQGAEYPTQAAAMTRSFNAMVRSAAADAGARFVDLAEAFARATPNDVTPLLTADGDHPNARGHAVIAHAVAARALTAR